MRRLMRACGYSFGLLAIVNSFASHLAATATVPAPEIDGGSISAGIALLSAGVLIVRARRRSR